MWKKNGCQRLWSRMEDEYGPDCNEFSPERWLDERGSLWQWSRPNSRCSTGEGVATCLGREMAAATDQGFEVERVVVASPKETSVPSVNDANHLQGRVPVRIQRLKMISQKRGRRREKWHDCKGSRGRQGYRRSGEGGWWQCDVKWGRGGREKGMGRVVKDR